MSKKIYSIAALSCVVTGCFVCSPVFAENPVDISIVEVVDDGAGGYKSWEDITGAMPGMTYSAIPRVRNDGLAVVDVRMCLSESAVNAAGETIVLPANTFGIVINEHWVIDDAESTDATDPAVGNCYKYDTELAVGAMTEPIFNEVSLNSELGNEYENNTFNLHLVAEAVGGEAPTPDEPTPAEPDTGFNTVSYFDIVSPVFFSTVAIATFAIVACVIRYLHRNN